MIRPEDITCIRELVNPVTRTVVRLDPPLRLAAKDSSALEEVRQTFAGLCAALWSADFGWQDPVEISFSVPDVLTA
jgi:hypothetical protein